MMQVESVPDGFSLQSMLVLGNGVNAAMKDWGTTMLKKYNTTRAVDYTTQWLGFSTDNGTPDSCPCASLRNP